MLRLIASLVLNILGNAVGLLAASAILSSFSVDASAFIVAVLIFSLTTVVLGPLVVKIAFRSAPYLMGGIALVTTFVALVVTNLLSDGISIDGLEGWLLAPLIIWAFSIIASLLLPLVIFKKTLAKHKNNNAPPINREDM